MAAFTGVAWPQHCGAFVSFSPVCDVCGWSKLTHDLPADPADAASLTAQLEKLVQHCRSYATEFPEDLGGTFGILFGLEDVTDPVEFVAGAINNLVAMRANLKDHIAALTARVAAFEAELAAKEKA